MSPTCLLSLCDWLLQGLEHWEEVFAVLEGETLSLFKDQEAAAQVPAETSGQNAVLLLASGSFVANVTAQLKKMLIFDI